ncbi:MAG: hypothetical protein HY301_09270 [Verrucomicrobia bacterium]|nr:hypothetical protein [Verrucomicrobiota bacterium]
MVTGGRVFSKMLCAAAAPMRAAKPPPRAETPEVCKIFPAARSSRNFARNISAAARAGGNFARNFLAMTRSGGKFAHTFFTVARAARAAARAFFPRLHKKFSAALKSWHYASDGCRKHAAPEIQRTRCSRTFGPCS